MNADTPCWIDDVDIGIGGCDDDDDEEPEEEVVDAFGIVVVETAAIAAAVNTDTYHAFDFAIILPIF
jgi:hypothetical protein